MLLLVDANQAVRNQVSGWPCKAWERRACSRLDSPCKALLSDVGPARERGPGRIRTLSASTRELLLASSKLDGDSYRECNVSGRSCQEEWASWSDWDEGPEAAKKDRWFWKEYGELGVEVSMEGGQLWAAMRQRASRCMGGLP